MIDTERDAILGRISSKRPCYVARSLLHGRWVTEAQDSSYAVVYSHVCRVVDGEFGWSLPCKIYRYREDSMIPELVYEREAQL